MRRRTCQGFTTLACFLCASACSSPAGDGLAPPTVRDSAGVQITTIEHQPNSLPSWRLGEAVVTVDAGNGIDVPHLEDVADATWLSDGRILVVDADARQLHLYDKGGKYQASWGGEGEGPSEFRRTGSLSVTGNDSIWVYDPALGMLKVFHPSVGFVRSQALRLPDDQYLPLSVWALGERRIMRYAIRYEGADRESVDTPVGRVHRRRASAMVSVHEAWGNTLVRELVFTGPYTAVSEQGEFRLPFANTPVVDTDGERIVYGAGDLFELWALDATSGKLAAVRWPSFGEPLTTREVDRARTQFVERVGAAGARMAGVIFADELLPEARPALGRVMLDADGRVWAARFEVPTRVRFETEWYVLEGSGGRVARLALPLGLRPYVTAIRGDQVLMVVRDAVDVSRVEVWTLVRDE